MSFIDIVHLYSIVTFLIFIYILVLDNVGHIPTVSQRFSYLTTLSYFMVISITWPLFLTIVAVHYLILRFK